jgi:hypothetical protein
LFGFVTGDAAEKCAVVTPAIRSVVITSPGRADNASSPLSTDAPGPTPSPRAGNRTLISWGFNSTTFTAEPLAQSSQWSVTVEKNNSKIGNINTGYLFGIGVAHEPLTSKDQVGLRGRLNGSEGYGKEGTFVCEFFVCLFFVFFLVSIVVTFIDNCGIHMVYITRQDRMESLHVYNYWYCVCVRACVRACHFFFYKAGPCIELLIKLKIRYM